MAFTSEQLSAINTRNSNIIVSAGAGSGKTAVLTERVLSYLKSGVNIDELLILTFTKAAAKEMQTRIRKKIKNEDDLQEQLKLLPNASITTFDAYALSLVKDYAYLLNIDPDISITDDTIITSIKNEILTEVFESHYQSDKDFQNLIKKYCVKDDSNIKKMFLKMINQIIDDPNKEILFANYFNQDDLAKRNQKLLEEFNNLIINRINYLKNDLADLEYIFPKEYYTKFCESLSTLMDVNNIDSLLPIRISLPSVPRNSDESIKEAKSKFKSNLDSIISLQEYGSSQDIINDLNDSNKDILVFINIIKEFINKLDSYLLSNKLYNFSMIASLATKLVRDFDSVRNTLKEQYQEIMIDEYQDTNDTQENFIKYISNNNVYTVGDIKQSIYRFRNANPYIFKDKYDLYSKNYDGIKIDLLKNFRSRSEVLNNINLIFNAIMDDYIGNANYIKEHQMVFGNTNYLKEESKDNYNMEFMVYNTIPNYTKDEIEVFTVCKDIKEKIANHFQVMDQNTLNLRDITYQDICIIVDRTTSFNTIRRIMEYFNIPVNCLKDEEISNNVLLSLLNNLLAILIKYQNHTYDQEFKYYLVSILRSFIFQVSDEDIFIIINEERYINNPLYNCISDLVSNLNTTPISNIVNQLLTSINYYEALTRIDDITANMMITNKVISMVSDSSNRGESLSDFTKLLNELITGDLRLTSPTNSVGSNAVKLMSIHKSKGLEFPLCYFIGLSKSFNIKDIQDSCLYDSTYGFCFPTFNEGLKSIITKELIKELYYLQEISEKIRLFYVAITRVREKMIFVLPEYEVTKTYMNDGVVNDSTRLKYRSFMDMIKSINHLLTNYLVNIDSNTLGLTKNYLNSKNELLTIDDSNTFVIEDYHIDTNIVSKNNYSKVVSELFSNEEKNNTLLGLEFHKTLEYMDLLNPQYDLITNQFIKDHIKQFINHQEIINKNIINIYHEYQFIDKGNRGIIDLLIEYPEKYVIIDYKLNGINNDAYKYQLKGYREYIEFITEKKVETYLYSILQDELLEIGDQSE